MSKIDHSTMNLDQLQNAHSNMLATASDLGFSPPDSTLVEITDEEQGRAVCDELHAAITKFRAGLDEDNAEKPPKQKSGAKKAASSKSGDAGSKKTVAKGAKQKQGAPASTSTTAKTEEKTMATKKAPAKKAAKKAPAKKAAAPATQRASAYDENAKINWIYKGEGNGCRVGTGRYDRVELVRKSNGKTVKTFIANGGVITTLRNAEKEGKVKVA